ncbi:MAG: GNAT family N-acetyltransferase [Lachnospiraceae bacterium]|nr:GNAT family N-acetyltransferase [Lachnospiraceae bacterium]
MKIRTATVDDVPRLLQIYTPYVEDTAITFEYYVPSYEEFKHRMEVILEKYPYLVMEDEDETIVGYAYVSPFNPRTAYNWDVELSIYLDENCKGKGYGTTLYHTIEDILKKQNVTNVYALVGVPSGEEDEYLNFTSKKFHEKMGFTVAGTYHRCGHKFERWYDVCCMEKMIGEHKEYMEDFIPYTFIEG